MYELAVLLMYTWYFSHAVVNSLPMFVLKVNIYSTGSNGAQSGSSTTVVSGIGGSVP